MSDADFEDLEDRFCKRCECCDKDWVECPYCGGNGGDDGESLMEEDPLWYGPEDFRRCDACKGKGGHYECLGHCDENGQHKLIKTTKS
jgi:hypothetical protein